MEKTLKFFFSHASFALPSSIYLSIVSLMHSVCVCVSIITDLSIYYTCSKYMNNTDLFVAIEESQSSHSLCLCATCTFCRFM